MDTPALAPSQTDTLLVNEAPSVSQTAGRAPLRAPVAAGPADAPSAFDSAAALLDRTAHAQLARWTGGLSPAAFGAAFWDWALHLASAPGEQAKLWRDAADSTLRFLAYATRRWSAAEPPPPVIAPAPHDRRFAAAAWRAPPYDLLWQGFLLQEEWWRRATTTVAGVSGAHAQMAAFAARQWLGMASPANFLLTNPVALQRTVAENGANLARGARHLAEDVSHRLTGAPPVGANRYTPGVDVAITPGRVVFRNAMMELIQYAPTTATTRPEPVLITPAWIMKYYILDLSPENSLIRDLVARGFTVFAISWRNPTEHERDWTFETYRQDGVMAALDAIGRIVPGRRIHVAGYCLGGTLLAIAAAQMGRDRDERLKTLTLFAAQTDFTEPGDLRMFINESQLRFLEEMMDDQGYLDMRQMAGAFQMLRADDLVWGYALKTYLLGEREPLNDLMAWNADGTRMPARMHAHYLRSLFLNNDLAEGRFQAGGRAVALSDIRLPTFVVATDQDHVAPWRSVFKIHFLADAAITFLLASGGHNAGVVADPRKKGRAYRVGRKAHGAPYVDPDAWLEAAEKHEGSWWPQWAAWLATQSGAPVPAKPPADGYGPAPGAYVLQR